MPQSGVPYGDAYILQSPKTDRAISLMYQEQKQRQAQQEQQNKVLDDAMSKEFANVRSADMGDVAQKWDQYKQLRKNVLFNKDIQNDPVKYNQANREAQIALSNVYGTINASKEAKTNGEDLRKSWLSKPDLYEDDFGEKYSKYIQTPVSQLHQVQVGKQPNGMPLVADLTNPESFRYQGANYNPVKDLDAARGGKPIPLEVDAGVTPNDPLKNRAEIYNMHPATADQYKTNIIASMGKRDAQKYWYNQLDQTSPAEIQKVNDAFTAIPADALKKFGINKPDLQYKNADSKAETVATYLAQKYFLENQPRLIKTEDRVNEAGKLAQTQAFAKQQQIDRQKAEDARNNKRILHSDQRAKDALTAGSDAPDKYITDSGTGQKLKGGDLDELSFPKEVQKEFVKTVKVPNSANDAELYSKGKPYKGKDITITPSFARNPSTGAIVAVYPVIDKKTGEVTTEPDMQNIEVIPYSKLRGVVGGKVINTKFKAGQYLGTPATKSTKGKPY